MRAAGERGRRSIAELGERLQRRGGRRHAVKKRKGGDVYYRPPIRRWCPVRMFFTFLPNA